MGTNYEAIANKCKTCGRKDVIHLGKSSAGWKFVFNYNGGRYYKNAEEMKKWTKKVLIYDEYGKRVLYSDFWVMVEHKQDAKAGGSHCIDIGGYDFIDSDFS